MLLSWIWLGMMAASLLYGCLTGRAGALLPAALDGASSAVSLSLRLMAGYLFFCGLMEIMKELRLPEKLARLLRPFLRRVMPTLRGEEARQAVTLNLTANLLGLGNAATPSGIEAVRRMEEEQEQNPQVRHALYMLLILNATGLQLFPTTVPRDLDIFWPSSTSQPWPNTCLGRGNPSACRMMGQMMVWKRMISLPTRCRSAGQNFRYSSS